MLKIYLKTTLISTHHYFFSFQIVRGVYEHEHDLIMLNGHFGTSTFEKLLIITTISFKIYIHMQYFPSYFEKNKCWFLDEYHYSVMHDTHLYFPFLFREKNVSFLIFLFYFEKKMLIFRWINIIIQWCLLLSFRFFFSFRFVILVTR